MYKHYFSLVVSQNFMFSTHTQGTQQKNRIFAKILIFSHSSTPYLWVQKCALCVRARQIFFSLETKSIYLKTFTIIILSNAKPCYICTCKQPDSLIFKKRLFWANYRTPPNETKSSKFLMLPATYHIYIIKHF